MANGIGTPTPLIIMAGLTPTSIEAAQRHNLGAVGLTVDELLARCQVQLNEADQQIRALLADQQTSSRTQKALAELETKLNREKGSMIEKGVPADQAAERTRLAYEYAIATVADPSVKAMLIGQRDAFLDDWNDGVVGEADMDARKATITNVLDDTKNGQEMKMLKLQSVVEQRARALTMFSNMIVKLEEAQKSIIQNMGR